MQPIQIEYIEKMNRNSSTNMYFIITDKNNKRQRIHYNKLLDMLERGGIELPKADDIGQKRVTPMSDDEIIKMVYKANILGILETFDTFCGNRCYLIHKSKTQHMLLVPSNVKELTSGDNAIEVSSFSKKMATIRGDIIVHGGSGLIHASALFECCDFTTMDLSNFDTYNIEDTSNMFRYCVINKIILDNFNDTSLRALTGMFYESVVTELNLSNLRGNRVEYINSMFVYCNASYIDLSNFKLDKNNIKYADNMFRYCGAKIRVTDPTVLKLYIDNEL